MTHEVIQEGTTVMALEGHVDFANAWEIRGWAVNSNQPDSPVTVEIVSGTQVVATIVANEFREDLKALGKSSGRHGFHYETKKPEPPPILIARIQGDGNALPRPRGEGEAPEYIQGSPTAQKAIDIFKGEWSSMFPTGSGLTAGPVPLFEDRRIAWAVQTFGGISGQRVLELGPLEGGHSYMLQNAGAASVIAIEAHPRAYLRCLVAKEILKMDRVDFRCGDFVAFLESSTEQFDLIVASGVLYHMTDPARVLKLLADHSKRVFLWTHYFDEKIIYGAKNLKHRFPTKQTKQVGNRIITMYRQEYQTATTIPGFCGGGGAHSYWIPRADILGLLEDYGFKSIKIEYEQPDHPFGPCFCVAASRE